MDGFLITCVMNKEGNAFKEFIAKTSGLPLLEAETCQFPVRDFAIQLRSELDQLKTKRHFAKIDTYKSILLISNHTGQSPSRIFTILRNMRLEFHNVLRILPLDTIIKFDEEKIRSFIRGRSFVGSFKILYEGRLCDPGMRERLFQVIIPLIPCKVSLDDPDYVVIAQAFKGYVGLSVVQNDGRKYNFSMGSKGGES